MDRTDAEGHIIIGGKRRYTDTGTRTIISPIQMSAIEEEIVHVIEEAGIQPDKNNWQQLRLAILNMASSYIASVMPVYDPDTYEPPSIASQFPSFRAWLSGDQWVLGNDTMNVLAFTQEGPDTNNNYWPSYSTFSPTVDGVYLFGINYWCTSIDGSNHNGGSLALFKNGVMYRNSNMPGGETLGHYSERYHYMVAAAYAKRGDWFNARVSQNTVSQSWVGIRQVNDFGNMATFWYGARIG